VPRRLKNWIDAFLAYTEGKGSPRLYRLWAAIFTVGAICERKIWLTTAKGKLYPNQYILLVGPAGIGKTLCTNIIHELLQEVRTPETPFHIAPTSVTKASLIDSLAEADRRIIRPMDSPAVVSFNSLTIVPNEFGVFLPSWEGDFMSSLTDLWDCKHYSETRRTHKININIPHAQLNMFSATTPIYLTNLLPEGAWEQGFMSRILIVYSGENIHTDLFNILDTDDAGWADLVHDLKDMYKAYGEVTVTDEAKLAINEWSKAGGPPIPDHPKLTSYSARRAAHLLKLCMVASMASDSDRIVTIDHFAEALDWLVQLETFMPDVFKSMKVGGDGRAIEECWHYARQVYMKTKQPVPEHRIVQFLQEKVPVHSIARILDVMERAKLLQKKYMDSGGTGYVPTASEAA
jgi:uncharacterized protein DUF3987